ncbi:hypothetical protein ANCCAN_23875 [Ancylostoma caninum]|uniref:Uncharacterized protein n=1 Tax=Ancylostoma caninum TaxID=29170 RepID=A0A368FH85_ANCCA|nr:hypothetical protein ANCCAN_23875 [Ancylostoma caninum]
MREDKRQNRVRRQEKCSSHREVQLNQLANKTPPQTTISSLVF